ncbi:DUF6528 family protein [Agriterribacter sp.]|uniref:DUF6528 family protein n=1 Tax=Agriterribacter sp. TaxID=2821509 RepID=UPI002D123B13|nr:DUF6528 family protein [Agriterribacter sp.]HRP55896.1 DUF6528 family protein [Agriterribacter sp.]
MKYSISILSSILLTAFLHASNARTHWQPEKGKKYIILSEQSKSRVAIADIAASAIVWEWRPAVQPDIEPEHAKWFEAMSDAKPLENGKYILACASGGGVALIRVSDKKTMFYAYAGGNTHSVEQLPDGNIVSASSTGNLMSIFVTSGKDYPEKTVRKDFYLRDGHNLVWDKKRKQLYTVSWNQLKTYRYNADKNNPLLTAVDSVAMPDNGAHDLYRAHDTDLMWLSTHSAVFKVSMQSKKAEKVSTRFGENIKSVSSGPEGYPTIIIRPKEKWWTDEVLDLAGNSIFKQQGLRIYKARWLL